MKRWLYIVAGLMVGAVIGEIIWLIWSGNLSWMWCGMVDWKCKVRGWM